MFGWFKKKSAVKNKEDRDLIEVNSSSVDALIVLTSDYNMKEELRELKEQIKYIIPLTGDKAYSMDKKISGLIGDIKIELVKDKDDDKAAVKVSRLIKELKVAVVERKALIQ